MKNFNKFLPKDQDYSSGIYNKKYSINPFSYSLIDFEPFITCVLSFKNDFWINRHSPSDRTFIPKVYLRSFSHITGTIFKDLCWSTNIEHIDQAHFHIHLVLFKNGLNPHRAESYKEILSSLWRSVLNLDDFDTARGLDKIIPPENPNSRRLLQKNYLNALDLHSEGSGRSYPLRVNLFNGQIVKNTTRYRCREFTGMGWCDIRIYDPVKYGKAGLFYNQKDQDQLSYCDFSPALTKKALLTAGFNGGPNK